MAMNITAAIPTYRRPDGVKRLLESIKVLKRLPDEILIVDSSLDEDTIKVVNEYVSYLPIRYFKNEKGLTRQRNRAINEAKGDIIAFFDDDIVFEQEFFKVIEDAFLQRYDIAGIAGFIINEWGKPIDRFWRIRKHLGLLPREYQSGRILPYGIALPLSTLQPFEGLFEVDWLPGGVTAWRREVFERYRYSTFFEGYGLAEDKQFSIRVSRSEKLAICGSAGLYHLKYPGGRPNHFLMGYYHVHNHLYLLATCFPEREWWRHYQQLWYWMVEVLLKISSVFFFGRFTEQFKTAFGMLWGITTHLFPKNFKDDR